jgi:hypothetical protein
MARQVTDSHSKKLEMFTSFLFRETTLRVSARSRHSARGWRLSHLAGSGRPSSPSARAKMGWIRSTSEGLVSDAIRSMAEWQGCARSGNSMLDEPIGAFGSLRSYDMKVPPAAAAHSADVPIAKWVLVSCHRICRANECLWMRSVASFFYWPLSAPQHEILAL